MVLEVCQHIQAQFGLSDVVLSGGVWQNMVLLTKVVGLLKEANFKVYWHRLVPTNDGGLALGQAAVALSRLENDFS
jgi:hydrogenase maturation protein HypF